VLGVGGPGDCAACGSFTLDRRREVSEAALERVKPIASRCAKCHHEWKLFPYEIDRVSTNALGESVTVPTKCPRCRRPHKV
jgi:hypothetical protein